MKDADRQAQFDHWMAEHLGILHRVARAFAEGADLDDLMQELLLAVWYAIPSFRGQAKPSTFLYRVSHNAALNWTRSHRRHRHRMDQLDPAEETQHPVVHADFHDLNAERLSRVYVALRALPPADRSLILLALDGLSYSEMAEVQGLSENHVGVRLTRIKARLAAQLKEERP